MCYNYVYQPAQEYLHTYKIRGGGSEKELYSAQTPITVNPALAPLQQLPQQ